ncbi:MAG: 2Fe-2S iron-sulfur cluster-binding protein [Alphaproteobacteria bacterium]|nr:2Fe-2S iron-sulfur cluster-binding protein [Alphaproteobacteria bacterium]
MARKFAEITFTPSVKAAQERYGSRRSNSGFEQMETGPDLISAIEASFIEARDGFYQATVNANGWPYVQFRGGPVGFLKVLDQQTLGYADFRGNVQYLSVGNLADNDRVSLILMDYPNRRRLKIWARAKIVEYDDDPALIEKLEVPTYRARVERGIILKVEAMDWNCPQHITPRFTEAEVAQMIEPMMARMSELEQQVTSNGRATNDVDMPDVVGVGDIPVVVSGIKQLTPEIRSYELKSVTGDMLPEFEAGAHLNIPVRLANGEEVLRSYSITSHPNKREIYEIAVKRDPEGRGGSDRIHQSFNLGQCLNISAPRNAFNIKSDNQHAKAVLIAGGIGITPILSLGRSLKEKGVDLTLHYVGKSRETLAYLDDVEREFRSDLYTYFSNLGQRIDLVALVKNSEKNTDFFICGPASLMTDFLAVADNAGVSAKNIYFESFDGLTNAVHGATHDFELHLSKSDETILVKEGETILNALQTAGYTPAFGCGTGTCGACAVKVSDGDVSHQDQALSQQERDEQKLFCPCVSTAASDSLTIDF